MDRLFKVGVFLYKVVVYINSWFNTLFGRTFGLGSFSFLVQKDFYQRIGNRKIYVDKRISGSYFMNFIGKWNEPETHAFLKYCFDQGTSNFVDIGANVGEMVVDAYYHPNVKKVFAFEPHPDCLHSLEESIKGSGINKEIYFFQMFVGGHEGTVSVNLNTKNTRMISIMKPNQSIDSSTTKITTLDTIFKGYFFTRPILKIDVEGAEYLVLKGAASFISNFLPVIIFEYHKYSRTCFSLDDISSVLGDKYHILRLRLDGKLDAAVNRAYNCVAIPKHNISTFSSLIIIN